MRSFLKYWLPVILWMALIFVGSTDLMSAEHTSRFIVPLLRWLKPDISMQTIAQVQFFVRKGGHVTEYAIFAMLLWRALPAGSLRQWWKPAIIALALASGYAALDEFHQSFVATRTASAHDVMIDICGALIGVMISLLLARRKISRTVMN